MIGTAPALAAARAPSRAVDEFIYHDALGLADLVKSGQTTAAELAEIFIRRAETIDPIVNCLAIPTYDRARQNAAGISSETRFAGVPFLVKDMVDVAGVRRTDGSVLRAANVPTMSPDYISAIEGAGLNMIATTVVPEFANGLSSDLYGAARNPWDLDLSCVASSSGAANAVAAGIAPLVHGTDGGGSNRLPSSACNLFGYKPTRERMYSGELDGSHDVFKSNGPISRSVRDAAAMFEVAEDPANPFGVAGFVKGPSSERLRIAYVRNGSKPDQPVEGSVMSVQDELAQMLAEMGHEVVEIEHPLDGNEFGQMFRYVFLPKFAPLLKLAQSISGQGAFDTGLLTRWIVGSMVEAQGYTADQIAQGEAYFGSIGSAYESVFSEFDMIFSATSPIETPEFNFIQTTDDFALRGDELEHVLSLTGPINAVGDCAMNVPIGFSDKTGNPVGSMFHAPADQDARLFALAYELEEAVNWRDRWAPYSLKHIPT